MCGYRVLARIPSIIIIVIFSREQAHNLGRMKSVPHLAAYNGESFQTPRAQA